MVEDEYITVSAGREYMEAACLVRVRFGGIGDGVNNCVENVVGVMLLLRVDVVAELLVWLGGTKIVLFLIKVAIHDEWRLGKMFLDEDHRQDRP